MIVAFIRLFGRELGTFIDEKCVLCPKVGVAIDVEKWP